jgi:hypothetical protein
MTVNLKLQQGLKEYRQKLSLGLIEIPKKLDPIEKAKKNPKSLRFAINAKCFDCSGFERPEVKSCEFDDCPLHRHRPWQKKASG